MGRVEAVFYSVLGPARKALGDLAPAVAKLAVRLVERQVLIVAPGISFDARVEVVEPALATLLAEPPRQLGRDL